MKPRADRAPKPKGELVTAICIRCGVPFRTRRGARYCLRHRWMRLRTVPETVELPYGDYEAPRFSPPDPVDLVFLSLDSLRVLRPDGTVDEVKTRIEQGRWLTRALQTEWEDQTDLV